MTAPREPLQILREYTCGCIVYRVQDNPQSPHAWREVEEHGLFCFEPGSLYSSDNPGVTNPPHKRALVKGTETQPDLFNVPVGTRHLDVARARRRT